MRNRTSRLFGAVLGFLLLCTSALAQDTSQISGVIQDADGEGLAGVRVVATQTDTDEAQSGTRMLAMSVAITDATGAFVLPNLQPGTYRVQATMANFDTFMRTGVVIGPGESPTMNFEMPGAPLVNLAHIHLLLNHFPTVGFGIGLALFFIALAAKSEDLKKASLLIFFLMSLLTMVTYVSGNAAQQIIAERPGVSEELIETHEDAALLASLFMGLTGAASFLGMLQLQRRAHTKTWTVPAVFILSIITFGLMSNAANIGGEIRHPEIIPELGPQAAPAHLELAKPLGALVSGVWWIWPMSETLHFIGLCLLFTVVLIVNLRMLGMAKGLSFAALYKLLPWGLLGFGINFLTGMLFFVTTPGQYTKNVAFYWKVVLILLGGINVLYFMLFDEPWKVESGADAPLRAKLIAASAIFIWLGVLFFGHMLPFIGNSF